MNSGIGGSTRLTAAGVVGVSGKPIRIFGFTMRSNSGGDGTAILYNGTSTGGTEKYKFLGVNDASSDKIFGAAGKFFPGGCFIDFPNTDVTYIDVDYLQEQTY